MRSGLLVSILLCASSIAGAGINTWTAVGPDGGDVRQIVYGLSPGTIFAIAGSGFYRSQDGSDSWQSIKSDFMNAPTGMAIDPSDASRVYVVAPDWPSLYVSSDSGATLTPSTTLPTAVTQAWQVVVSQDGRTIFVTSGARVFRSMDRGLTWAERSAISADPGARINRLVIDPTDATRLYAGGTITSSSAGILRSQDGGLTWQVMLSGAPGSMTVQDLGISAANPLQVWAATNSGLYRSPDRGNTWTDRFPGAAGGALGLSPSNADVIYAGLQTGNVWRSTNAGLNWQDITNGQGGGQVESLAVHPATSAAVLLGGFGGLYGSSDSGATWYPRQTGIIATWIKGLSADASSGRTYLNTQSGGIYYTTSGSSSTSAVNNDALRLLDSTPSSLFTISMLAQPGRLLVSLSSGLARSTDGGNSWLLTQVAPTGTRQLFFMAGSATTPQTILAAGNSDLFRSVDGGLLWNRITAGIPVNAGFWNLLVAPSDGRLAYAALYDGSMSGPVVPLGIHRSTDGGLTWSAASTTPASDPRLLAVDPIVPTTLYGSTATSLVKSTNGGATWTTLNWVTTEWRGEGIALAVDPQRTQTLYALSTTRVGRSVDGGTSWQTLYDTTMLPRWWPSQLLVDANISGQLLVASSASGLQKITIAPDLVLGSTPPALPTGTGVPLTYRFPFSNQGPFDSTGTRLAIQWPASATGVTVSSSVGSCAVVGNAASCPVETFRTGSTGMITLTLSPASAGTFEVQASIQGDQQDSNATNNAVLLQTTLAARADLSVTATGTATVQVGGTASHTITVRNAGPNTADSPTLTFQLPVALAPTTASASQGTCTVNALAASVSCALGNLASGASVTVSVNSNAAVPGAGDSVARISSITGDGSSTDNSASVPTTVSAAPSSPGGGGGSGGGGGGAGGGGAMTIWELLLMLAGLGLRQRAFWITGSVSPRSQRSMSSFSG